MTDSFFTPTFVPEAKHFFPDAVFNGRYLKDGVIYTNAPQTQMVQSVKIMRDLLDLEQTPEFQHSCDLVEATPYLRFYRLRESVLREQAISLGYDPQKIPSLNPDAPWRPKTIYEELKPLPKE